MDFTKKMLRDDALKGKTIIVTGGGSGLGKAMTKYFMTATEVRIQDWKESSSSQNIMCM